MSTVTIVLVIATSIAAAIDVRTRRIPNVLTGAAALAAVVLHFREGAGGELIAIGSMLLAFVIGSFAYSAGWFGGGDVKLIAACCALVPFPAGIALVLAILVAGAVMALVTATARGRLVGFVRSTAIVALHGAPTEQTTLPYGVAIAGGSFAYAIASLVHP